MKIAFVGPRGFNYPAGIDRVVTELAKHLAERGHQITFYHRKKSKYVSSGLECKHVATLHTKHLETPLYAFVATIRAIFGKHDVIHFQGLGSACCIPLARLFTKAKIVTTIHAPDWEGRRWSAFAKMILKLSARIALKFSHEVITVSQSNLDALSKLSNKPIHLISNGIDLPKKYEPNRISSYGLEKDNFILFLGRLTPGKGCEYLIDAYNASSKSKKLVIAGDTIHDRAYVNKLKKMSGPDIIFTGWVNGGFKKELFSNAYIFIQPSDLEGLSGTTLEAMSYGLCIIASDLPSNIEALKESGIYFKTGSVEELKNILETTSKNSEKIEAKGLIARERVKKNYAWNPIIDETERIYGEK